MNVQCTLCTFYMVGFFSWLRSRNKDRLWDNVWANMHRCGSVMKLGREEIESVDLQGSAASKLLTASLKSDKLQDRFETLVVNTFNHRIVSQTDENVFYHKSLSTLHWAIFSIVFWLEKGIWWLWCEYSAEKFQQSKFYRKPAWPWWKLRSFLEYARLDSNLNLSAKMFKWNCL